MSEKFTDVNYKGFILNEKMLKDGPPFGGSYFDEMIERVQEIRSSKRKAYQRLADVFEQCSYDYDKSSETTKAYYALVWKRRETIMSEPELIQKIVDYAEQMAKQSVLMSMEDWITYTTQYLKGGEPD